MKKFVMKKALATGMALIMMGAALTGCGGDSLQETDELHVYNLIDDKTRNISGFYEQVSYLFPIENPDIKFDYRKSDIDYTALTFGNVTPEVAQTLQQHYDGLSVDIMKGKCEDVVFADTFYQWFDEVTPPDYEKMIRAGAFLDLKPLLAEYAPDVDLSVYDDLLIDGKLYAVPVWREPYRVYSAEKMLADWEFPYDPNDDVLTFLRKCAEWQKQHEKHEIAPVVFTKQAWDNLYLNIFNIMGLDVVNYDEAKANFNQPEIKEALELLKQLKSDYIEPNIADFDSQSSMTQIYNNALFGIKDATYDSNTMRAIGYNYLNDASVIIPLRQLDGKCATTADAYLMIPTSAKNKRNAAKYVAFVLKSFIDLQKGESKITFLVSNRSRAFCMDVDEAKYKESLERSNQKLYASADYEETCLDMYHNQGNLDMPNCWYHSLKKLFDDYMNDTITIDTLVEDVQKRLKIYVSE